jgi:sRNA-binding carbon storage regulator CsrA
MKLTKIWFKINCFYSIALYCIGLKRRRGTTAVTIQAPKRFTDCRQELDEEVETTRTRRTQTCSQSSVATIE